MTISRLIPFRRRSMLLGLGALAALVGAGAASAAADGPGHGHGRGGPLFHMLRRLDLSDDQKVQIRGLVEEARPRLQPLVEQAVQTRKAVFQAVAAPTFDEAAVRAASQAAAQAATDLAVERARLTSQVRAVLTADQQAELDQKLQRFLDRSGRRSHWRHRTGEPAAAASL
jgi:Spy/CpxP family protein refolding chaperone